MEVKIPRVYPDQLVSDGENALRESLESIFQEIISRLDRMEKYQNRNTHAEPSC